MTVRWKDQEIDIGRLSQLYVSQRVRVYSDSHEEIDDSKSFVRSRLLGSGGGLIFILADAGHGKTWLTWALAHDAASNYLRAVSGFKFQKVTPPPIPFVIPFSQYKRLTSFDGIVLERLNTFGTLDVRAEGFKHILAKGRIVLILDGFDEMLELSPAHARANLLEIERHMHGLSKLILTSRRTLFGNRNEIADFLRLSGTDPRVLDLTLASLEGFTKEQLTVFYKVRGASDAEMNTIFRLPIEAELQKAPQIAEYVLDLARRPQKQGIETWQNVFESILSLIYARENDKWVRDGSPPMPPDVQETFLTEIALVMWPHGYESHEIVQMQADALGHHYLANHHLLQPTLDGQLQFAHHVWRDWFMARGLRLRIEDAGWDQTSLNNYLANPLPDYCVRLLGISFQPEKVEKALGEATFK